MKNGNSKKKTFKNATRLNIYSKKIVWKRILIVLALLIVGASFWYTNILVNEMANEERKQVKLWAEAIQKKARLVSYTNTLFKRLEDEERKKVELWVAATKYAVNSGIDDEIKLALDVIESNTTIPIISVNKNGKIISSTNVDQYINLFSDSIRALPQSVQDSLKQANDQLLEEQLAIMKSQFEPIEEAYYGNDKNYLYYKESKLVEDLRITFNDLQNSFIQEIVANSASTPVLYVNHEKDSVLASGNMASRLFETPDLLQKQLAQMSSENEPIVIDFGDKEHFIFYKDSALLNQLKYYPLIQFVVIGLFILIGYWLFSISRKSEQNQVWVGMSKETAHQLGTPLSSLIGWIELLKAKELAPEVTQEMAKDIHRLEMITDRFSKIGAQPKLEPKDVVEVINKFIVYLKTRSSSKVIFEVVPINEEQINAQLNVPLFEWVIENLCKNAIDAMAGNGKITLRIEQLENDIFIDVTDTGKGISSSKRKTVFQPGYTSKKRGWGLGLSLSKRIIENYHRGKIFVKSSEPEKGTTFRIILKA